MKFTLDWLHDHLETDATLDIICDTLNRIGLEVEEVIDPASKLAGFEVAEIVSTEQHPDADRLKICTVKSGQGEQKLVCGAPNARAGLKGILANEGAVIPANGMVLGKAKIRGVESRGMMCSLAELELSEDHDGIIELSENAVIGIPAAEALGNNGFAIDPVIEIAITPNRPDCLGVRGIARDLAAAGLGTLKSDTVQAASSDFESDIKIKVATPDCPVFAGRVIRGLKNGASPDWLSARLQAIGQRRINTLVDITNYISFDRGRPLHVYDVSRLSGTVTARAGQAGEKFMALDEESYEIDENDCVIADDKSVLGFGGVKGGLESGANESTTEVLVESAWFEPIAIANTGRRHGIDSDARYRFERGVDPQSVLPGLDQAVQMITQLCGGEVSSLIQAGDVPDNQQEIAFDPHRVKSLTGIDLTEDNIEDILLRLGFEVTRQKEKWQVKVPTWRPDVHGSADLVEEVTRIYGLDNVPSVPLPSDADITQAIQTPEQTRIALARRIMAGSGLTEAVTWSFIAEAVALKFGGHPALKLANPISSELSNMRPSLLPGLLQAAGRNVARGLSDFGLFEVGQIFTDAMPGGQETVVAALRYGHVKPRDWSGPAEPLNLFKIKADALTLLTAYGVQTESLQVLRDTPDWYHPGQSGVICRDPRTPLARFGALHPALLKDFDLDGPVMICEIFPMAIPLPKKKPSRSKPVLSLSPYQAVRRDFAFEVAADLPADKLMKAARGADKKLISNVALFDAFTGSAEGAGALGEGMKSLAIEVTLSPMEATLTDAEIEAAADKIIQAVEKATGGKLRR
ncbi:MAG: phenylalanine--tRNA ligase subunit beta [Alphaproteobacteria bacterium]|nr:phenylalanine--tRNA ligase subunit beta [Alphaproteobacteria bacterium]